VSAHGPRFDPAGYQAPRTDAVSLKRERPIEQWHGSTALGSVVVEIVPLSGGKPGTFDVAAQWFEVKEVAGQHGRTLCSASMLLAGFREGTIPPWPTDGA
jgi:hypothetical protein